jgi:hypothetical protein
MRRGSALNVRHFKTVDDDLARKFDDDGCVVERWGVFWMATRVFLGLCRRMRRLLRVLIGGIVLAAASCASPAEQVAAKEVAARVGVPESKITELALMAAKAREMVVTRVTSLEDRSFQVWLADAKGRPHGIVVVFRNVNGQWVEDAKSQGKWDI